LAGIDIRFSQVKQEIMGKAVKLALQRTNSEQQASTICC